MFPFGRKKDKGPVDREEKERRKREKKEKQGKAVRDGGRLSAEDLQRLEEVRRTLSGKGGAPDDGNGLRSGITADYRDLTDPEGSGSSRGDSLTRDLPPPLPTSKPPMSSKKGILKGTSRGNYDVSRSVSSDLDDANTLLKNTKDNEYNNVYRRSALSPMGTKAPPLPPKPGQKTSPTDETDSFADREVSYEVTSATKVRLHTDHISPVSPDKAGGFTRSGRRPVSLVEPEFSKDVLTGECVGRTRPLSAHFPLQMPRLINDQQVVRGHEICLEKVNESFGIDVRKFNVLGKSVLLVEPVIGEKVVNLMPGDILVSVNGTSVEGLDREAVMKLIRATESECNVGVSFEKLVRLH